MNWKNWFKIKMFPEGIFFWCLLIDKAVALSNPWSGPKFGPVRSIKWLGVNISTNGAWQIKKSKKVETMKSWTGPKFWTGPRINKPGFELLERIANYWIRKGNVKQGRELLRQGVNSQTGTQKIRLHKLVSFLSKVSKVKRVQFYAISTQKSYFRKIESTSYFAN